MLRTLGTLSVTLLFLVGCGREEASRTLALDLGVASERVRFVTARGALDLQADAREGIGGEVVVKADGLFDLDNLRSLARRATVSSILDDDGWQVVTVLLPDASGASKIGANLSAVVPNGLTVGARTSQDTLTVQGLAIADIHNTNGPIRLTRTSGSAVIENSNNSIRIREHRGEIDVRTTNGGIELTQVRGSIKAQTTNADIVVDADPLAGDSIVLQTSAGDVSLRLPDGLEVSLVAHAPEGRVNVEGLEIQRTLDTSERIEGGAGEAEVTVRIYAYRGNVSVRGVRRD